MSKGTARDAPALVLIFGGEDSKPRPLDRDVITLGRARGTDISLEAPDVSSLHCVIWRSAAGYQIRDCGSRAGTKVNGDLIEEGLLHDGDVLQVGPFSFRVQLPAVGKIPLREARHKHVERSRRNLVRLALALRQRLRESHLHTQGV